MSKTIKMARLSALALLAAQIVTPALASSHMDAPLITRDPTANTTDVYAFVQNENGVKTLVTALGVYPFEEPGIGPNILNFDPNVLYQIHIALGADVAAGRPTISYQFQFKTSFKTQSTILASFVGVVQHVGDASQNLTQTYTVTKLDHRTGFTKLLGRGIVPPNNGGVTTPYYNQGDNGNNPAKDGVATDAELDRYTSEAITNLGGGYTAFAGQRDDGFYADIESIFDLLQLRSPGKDNQAGYNIHLMALAVPVSELGGDQQVVGVYATTSRRQVRLLSEDDDEQSSYGWVQVARQGNPLFNEGLVALADKDLYSRTGPWVDSTLFKKYALNPELARLINAIVFHGSGPAPETNRTDIAGIYIPDVIKCDLSTDPCRLGGNGTTNGVNPNDPGFSRLGIFGGDTLTSTVQAGFGGGTVPGGWPNGRRFGDDVVDIAVTALISDLRGPLVIRVADGIDGVNWNDKAYNKVFPYESTPHNGRNRTHP
jgi:hypothetical protein